MPVAGTNTITVVDLDRVAVGAFSACVDNDPGRCRSHWRSPRPRQVQTGMERELVRERIPPYTKAAGGPVIGIDGPQPRHSVHSCQRIQQIVSIGQLRKIFAVAAIRERPGQRERRGQLSRPALRRQHWHARLVSRAQNRCSGAPDGIVWPPSRDFDRVCAAARTVLP